MTQDKNQPDKNMPDDTQYNMETHLIYGKIVSSKWDYSHHVVAPLSSSVIFRLNSAERGAEGFSEFANTQGIGPDNVPIYIYDRLGEPNKDMLEENLAYIERGEMAVSFATGMGAIAGILAVLTKSGDEIVAHKSLYGCTYSLLNNWYPRYNIKTVHTDMTSIDEVRSAVTKNTKVLYFETPANPTLDIIDIPAMRVLADEINKDRSASEQLYIVVDNTFATPYCQRPLELGAHFVLHSLTKGIGGFGTDMGGVVIGPKQFRDMLLLVRKDFGAVLGAKAAWTILTYGLPTLHLRISRQVANAMKVAEYLEKHPKVAYVNYPGLPGHKFYELAKREMRDFNGNFAPGSLIFFVVKGKDLDEMRSNGRKVMNYAADFAYTLTLAVSLGHTRTLVEHPASMTHSAMPPQELLDAGIHPGGIRLAVGLEHPEDLIKDLERCLAVI